MNFSADFCGRIASRLGHALFPCLTMMFENRVFHVD